MTIPVDAPPWARRLQAPLSDVLNRVGADISSIRTDVADIDRPEITGSRSSNTIAVLTELLAALEERGLITDSTTP